MAPGPPWLVSGFRFRARLGFSIPSTFSGPRGITPAFGYGAPHSSARGTSTLLSDALLSAHYGILSDAFGYLLAEHINLLLLRSKRKRKLKFSGIFELPHPMPIGRRTS